MKFHKKEIEKGVYGELSKIKEELEEAFDAEEQGQDLMLLIELSDIVGAVEGVSKKYGMTLEQLIEFAKLRSHVAIIEEKEQKKKHYHNFTMILSSYKCNRGCPYCIAKIDKLPETQEDLFALDENLKKLSQDGYTFDNFVLSGNGEPSMYSYNVLRSIRDIIDSYPNLFKNKRIQTSGKLFLENDNFELFKDWLIEITRVSLKFEEDSLLLGHTTDYTLTENYSKATLRVNVVLLKENVKGIYKDVEAYLRQPNVKSVALKVLDNKNNNWISEKALGYSDLREVIDIFNRYFGRARESKSNYIWVINNRKTITLSKNDDYLNKDTESLYWYGNDFLKRDK